MRIIFFILLLGTTVSSCRKKIIKYDSNYEGFWKSKDCSDILTISGSGEAKFNYYYNCSELKTYLGKAKANKKSIRIGWNTFNVQHSPSLMDSIDVVYFDGNNNITYKSIFFMKLEDKVFYKLIGK